MARSYRLPLASLLMPEPLPPTADPRPKLDDYRVFDGRPATQLSPETITAIEEAFTFLDALEEIRATDPEIVPERVLPACRITDNAEEVAERERATVAVSVDAQLGWVSDREAFLSWREAIEARGVFTYQLKIGNDDVRGFAIWDDRQIPIVVVDGNEDPYPARSFTIWHEYAHLLLRMGGISNQNRNNEVERFCNQFAAHFLMPREVFEREARVIHPSGVRWSDWHIERLAQRFKVSKSAVAIHLEETELAHEGLYDEMMEEWRRRSPAKVKGRATHIERYANRLGGKYLDAVLTSVKRGVITKLDAFDFTNIKPEYFDGLRREVIERRAAYGRAR